MVRIQFEITDAQFERAKPFIGDEKYRHYWASQAFDEKVTRCEGYDKQARIARLKTDAKYIQEMIDAGLIIVPASKVKAG